MFGRNGIGMKLMADPQFEIESLNAGFFGFDDVQTKGVVNTPRSGSESWLNYEMEIDQISDVSPRLRALARSSRAPRTRRRFLHWFQVMRARENGPLLCRSRLQKDGLVWTPILTGSQVVGCRWPLETMFAVFRSQSPSKILLPDP